MATTLIHDTFTEASPPVDLDAHTPEDGGSWTSETSIWGVSGPSYEHEIVDRAMTGQGTRQIARNNTLSVTVASYHSEDPLASDLDIYWDLAVWFGKFVDTECSIVWKAKLAEKDGYALEYDGLGTPATDNLRLVRYDDGTPTQLWNLGSWFSNDTLQKIRVTHLGDEITVYIWEDPGGGFQWVQKTQQTDSTYTSGKFLLLDWGSQNISHDAIQVDVPDSPPVKPTIAIADQGPDYIDYTSSAFSYGVPNAPHYASQWQVTLAADTGFATPVIDVTSTNVATFEAFHAGSLNLFQNQYIGRVRHQDDLLRWSDWSDASTASSLESSGQFYTAFAERPIGINLRTDIPADWSELDPTTDESSWFLQPRADATCLVTSDRISLNGDANTVDPILWEGFPSVASQIVFGRFIFDTIQADQEACTSGVADASGIVCRETYGLKHLEYGAAGSGGINPAGNTDPIATVTCFVFDCGHLPCGLPGPSYGDALATDWVQVAWKRNWPDPYAERRWTGFSVGIQSLQQSHLCGAIYGTYGWLQMTGVGTVSPNVISAPPPNFWNHNKFGNGPDNRATRHLAWESHIGHPNETRKGTLPFSGGAIDAFMAGCDYEDLCIDGLPWTFPKPSNWSLDEWIVCAGNTVRILDLPLGWKVQIGGTGPHVSTGSAFWPQPIYGDASNDQEIDFGPFAFPADTMYVWFADNDDPASPDIVWDVPTGIWGGDVYRIKPTVVGAAGVGARLSGTFEGSDGSGYIAYLDATGGLKLDKWTAAGGLVNLDSDPFVMLPGRYYNVVLEATGTTIRAKAWEGGAGLQGDPENNDPGTWAISLTDATYPSGAPGLVGLTQQPVDFDAFAAGLGGDTYPTGRYPGACSWVNPISGVVLNTGDSPLLLQWTAAPVTAGVLGGELSYELEFQIAGDSSWSPLANNIRGLTYSWDLSNLPQGTYCVQVRAYAGCEVGPWANTCFQWLGGVSKVPDGYFFGDWYTGEADVGQWIRLFQASHFDDLLPVNGCLVTRELMPAGVGGECLFQKLYVTVTTTTTGVLAVTPILDGRYLIEERRFVSLDNLLVDAAGDPIGTTGRKTRRYEIDLTLGFGDPEEFRYGYRGTYWQVEICATDYTGQGRIEIDGVFMRYTVVRETHAWARPFTGELEVDVVNENLARFFFGTSTEDATAAIYLQGDAANTDFGERLRAWVESNTIAPFGVGNEAWFRTLYISVTRTNQSAVTLAVTPELDGTPLETATITLPAVVGKRPVTEIHEVPMSVPSIVNDIEVGRYGARGVWLSHRILTSSQLAVGELIFNGAAIEAIPVRETEPGVT